jgi:hypothetical protein
MKRPCIFCQQFGKLTEEHLWSDWIGKLFGEREEYTVQRRLPNGELKQWETVGLNQTATIVCGKCNSGWMSDIETQTKRVLSDLIKYGHPISFLPAGIATLVAFTFKNAIISDHTHRERKPFFSVSDRVLFMNKLKIPDGVQMWIASSGSDQFRGVFQSYIFEVPAPDSPFRSADFLSFTWSAGYLVLQVLAPRWKRSRRKDERLPMLTPDSRWDPVSVRFWPNDGRPITWDPASDLSGNSLDVFKNRWSEPVTLMVRRT